MDWESLTDADLVSIAMGENASGLEADEDAISGAFEALWSRHYHSVAKVAYAALGSTSELEDIVQSSFLAAFRSLKSLEDRSKFRYWVRAIAANEARDLVRRQTYFGVPDSLDELITISEQPDDIVEASWQLEEIGKHLPERYVKVLYLRYYLGYTVKEVAQLLGVDSGLVKWRASRARKLASRVLRGVASGESSSDERQSPGDHPTATDHLSFEDPLVMKDLSEGLSSFKTPANKEVNQSGQIGSGSGSSSSPPICGDSIDIH